LALPQNLQSALKNSTGATVIEGNMKDPSIKYPPPKPVAAPGDGGVKPQAAKPGDAKPDAAKSNDAKQGNITCKSRDEGNVRKDYYNDQGDGKSKTKACIIGGNFSVYNGEVRKGNCKPVTTFPAGAKGQEVPPCPAGKNICNPMLYCGDKNAKDGKFQPLCESIHQELTEACDKAADPNCDPFSDKMKELRFRDEWPIFKDVFDNLCGKKSGTFVAYFCHECDLMSKRVRAANDSYNKAPSGDQPAAPAAPPATAPAPATPEAPINE
jgi:hypothetical protein